MPKYLKNKRRRRHNLFTKNTENIEMHTSEKADSKKSENKDDTNSDNANKSSFRILKGKKKAKKIRRFVLLGIIAALIITLCIISWLSPTGLGEMITNFTATFSLKSHLPVELNGTETYSIYTDDGYFFLLSDTDVSCISNNGKVSFVDKHGFNSPVLCESEARCLIYDAKGTGVRVYNAKKQVYSNNFENKIHTADIGRNGSFVIGGESKHYTSTVSVFDKNGNLMYEWNCPEETVYSVAIAPDGESVAVVTIDVENGEYISTLYVLQYHSADAVFKKEYKGQFVQCINSISKKHFSVIFENQCDIIDWGSHAVNTYTFDYDFVSVHSTHDYTAIATKRENDQSSSRFYVFNSSRNLKVSFDFNGKVDDFRIDGSNIFVLSGNMVYLINSEGKVAKKGEAGFGTVAIVPVSTTSCLAVSHNSVVKFELK